MKQGVDHDQGRLDLAEEHDLAFRKSVSNSPTDYRASASCSNTTPTWMREEAPVKPLLELVVGSYRLIFSTRLRLLSRPPLTVSVPAEMAVSKGLSVAHTKPPFSILLVDGNYDTREMYATALRSAGFRVLEAGDGAEALTCASAVLPDAIVSDISIPTLDGLELLERLRRDERTRQAVFVALTSLEDPALRQRASLAGAAAFLIKPCLPDSLVVEILNALRSRSPASTTAT